MAKAIPDGYHSVTPSFTFKDSQKAMDFYKKAFGAKVLGVFPNFVTGRGIMHATIQIGSSILMMGDEMGGPQSPKSAESLGGCPMTIFLYVSDADATFKQALSAGAQEIMPMADQFWGDRAGSLKDPFGYTWMIATHKQDLSPEETRKNAQTFFAKMAKNERQSLRMYDM